jgi:hypothetical protein
LCNGDYGDKAPRSSSTRDDGKRRKAHPSERKQPKGT